MVLAGLGFAGAAPAHAATEPITVSLYHVVEKHCDEGGAEACPNDYYPQFKIDGKGCTDKDNDCNTWDDKDDFCCAHDTDFRTNWTRTVQIDTTKNLVNIELELWDQDANPDDPIHWVSGRDDLLALTFDRTTCTFTGGGLTASQGGGVPNVLAGESESDGSDSARGYFTITTPSCLAKRDADGNGDNVPDIDSDGDGIPDSWESPTGGIDINHDGTVDYKPFDDGALPYRKDLFVDADYMTGDQPQPGAIDDVITAFRNAPVDGGVSLHIDQAHEDAVPSVPVYLFEDTGPTGNDDFWDFKTAYTADGRAATACPGFFGTAADRSDANCKNILDAKRQIYRYMMFGNQFSEHPDSSGESEIGGNDFTVTLGTWSTLGLINTGGSVCKGAPDVDARRACGRKAAEESTFMHEFGHALGLKHGGDEDMNCKPNYLSVMNYALQFKDFDDNRPLDYSSGAAKTALGLVPATQLDEAHLNENRGVFGDPFPARNVVYGIGGKKEVQPATSGEIDWNGLSGSKESDIPANINYIEAIGEKGDEFGCNLPDNAADTMHGHDDWASLDYNFRDSADFADGRATNTPAELDLQTVLAMSQEADVKITKVADQAEAVAGDTVTYTTTVTDLGPGTAKDIKVTDTLPDGTKVDRTLSDLDKDATNTIDPKFTYLVPCTATNGSVLTNNVSVTANDADGIADPNVSDNTAKATTNVLAPVLSLSETATPTVDAGDPITYTLSYENTGGAAASNVTISDTLPAGVYYSKALDTGTGPQPDTVARNLDGTTTLTWTVASLAASSGAKTIAFTARPGLLSLPGDTVADSAKLSFSNANGCSFAPIADSATTTISAAPVLGDARSRGHWNSHPADWTADVLARIQATDQRFDGLDPFGLLTAPEVGSTLEGDSELVNVLRAELLTMYLNLGSRHIGAGTLTDDTRADGLGLKTVRDVALFAQATLELPAADNKERYQDAIHVVSATHGGDSAGGTTSTTNPVAVGSDLGSLPAPQGDFDHDGFADSRDACPTVAGSQNGCVVVRVFAHRLVPAGVTLRARRSAVRRGVTVVASGRVIPNTGLSVGVRCGNGHVTVVVKAGALTVSQRAVKLAGDCTYRSTVRIAGSRIGARTVSVRASFTGNDMLKRRTSRSVVAR